MASNKIIIGLKSILVDKEFNNIVEKTFIINERTFQMMISNQMSLINIAEDIDNTYVLSDIQMDKKNCGIEVTYTKWDRTNEI